MSQVHVQQLEHRGAIDSKGKTRGLDDSAASLSTLRPPNRPCNMFTMRYVTSGTLLGICLYVADVTLSLLLCWHRKRAGKREASSGTIAR
eukprot:2187039-Amphidinium_carterae.2